MAHRSAVRRPLGSRDKLGIPDPIGAHGGDADPPGAQLKAEGAAVAEQKGLGGRIDPQAAQRLKGGGGADLQHMAPPPQPGQADLGDVHGGLGVEQHHVVQFRPAEGGVGADPAHSGGVYQPPHIRPLRLQQRLIVPEALLLRQVQGNGPQPARPLPGHRPAPLPQPVRPAGDQPELLHLVPPGQPADKLRSQPAGCPGHHRDPHTNPAFPPQGAAASAPAPSASDCAANCTTIIVRFQPFGKCPAASAAARPPSERKCPLFSVRACFSPRGGVQWE